MCDNDIKYYARNVGTREMCNIKNAAGYFLSSPRSLSRSVKWSQFM